MSNNMMQPPKAEKIRHKYEMHGLTIEDDYHWLRDPNWPEVKDEKILSYLKSENSYTEEFFKDKKDEINSLFEEFKSRIKLSDQSLPTKSDDYYYYTRTEEDKNYPIFCRKFKNLDTKEEVILDVNNLAAGKDFTKISALSISPDHKLLAYSVDDNGSEKYTIRIKNLETGELLEDKISSTIGNVHWHEDGSGFFYTLISDNWRPKDIKFHKLGNSNDEDILVYHESNDQYTARIFKSSSKEMFFIKSAGHGSESVFFFHMKDKTFSPRLIFSKKENIFYDVDHGHGYLYVLTNDQGPNFRLARIAESELEDISAKQGTTANLSKKLSKEENNNQQHDKAEEYLKDFLKYNDKKYLESFDITKSYVLVNYKNQALPEIFVHSINGETKEIKFPDNAFEADIYSTNFKEDDIRVSYSSLKRPDSVFFYDFEKDKLELAKQKEIPSGFNPSEYEVERIWAESKDKTKVPITLFYKKDLFKRNGTNPLFLTAYGSYGISMPVSFRNGAVSLANRGFIYALAHIRGGDDLGFHWYESAKFLNKKRTFEDFIASAKYLIEKKYTSKGNIAISGGSAGGMLIGNVLNQEPELFKAAIANVPFVDVLNTMLDESLPLTPGEFKEWGNPKEKEYFEYILSYCPYNNIKPQEYPHIFVTAGISDPRVTYWEAAKWVAKLREYNTSKNLILLKTNMSSGHMGASGRFDALKEVAEEFTFIFSMFKNNKN